MTVAGMIFDVDGTLVDSNGLHASAWERAFASEGFTIPAGRILPFIGKAGEELIRELISLDPVQAKRIAEREPGEFERLARHDRISPFPGADDLLRELARRGVKLAIATSGGRGGYEVVRETTDLPALAHMDAVVTGDDVQAAKPAPDLVSKAALELGLAPGQCRLIGDTPYDGEAATRAGVPFIGLTTGVHTEEALRNAGALRVYSGPHDLLKDLDRSLACSEESEERPWQ
jgi:HAD superfamily hydrolase (TIGR01509 family)